LARRSLPCRLRFLVMTMIGEWRPGFHDEGSAMERPNSSRHKDFARL